MSIERWDPFRDALSLRDAMDRLLQESFVRPPWGHRGVDGGTVALDVRENENEYTVEASLPGVKPEDVQIQVMGDTITISGETRREREQRRGENVLMHERQVGSFTRSLTLPMPIDADRAEAHFEHGVLALTLPKAEQARPRRIQVHGAAAGTQGGAEQIPLNTGQPGQEPGTQADVGQLGGDVQTH